MAESQKAKEAKDTHRQVIYVPLNVSYLLTLVANYQFRTKASVANDIWKAGLCSYLGLTAEDCEEVIARPLPRGAVAPKDPKELVDKLLG